MKHTKIIDTPAFSIWQGPKGYSIVPPPEWLAELVILEEQIGHHKAKIVLDTWKQDTWGKLSDWLENRRPELLRLCHFDDIGKFPKINLDALSKT